METSRDATPARHPPAATSGSTHTAPPGGWNVYDSPYDPFTFGLPPSMAGDFIRRMMAAGIDGEEISDAANRLMALYRTRTRLMYSRQ